MRVLRRSQAADMSTSVPTHFPKVAVQLIPRDGMKHVKWWPKGALCDPCPSYFGEFSYKDSSFELRIEVYKRTANDKKAGTLYYTYFVDKPCYLRKMRSVAKVKEALKTSQSVSQPTAPAFQPKQPDKFEDEFRADPTYVPGSN